MAISDRIHKLLFRFKGKALWHMRHYSRDFKVIWGKDSISENHKLESKFDFKSDIQSFDSVFLNADRKYKLRNICEQKDLRTKNIVILASGPSAKKFDLSKFSNHDLAYVNGAITLKLDVSKDIKEYHFVSDPNFIQKNLEIFKVINFQNVKFIYSVRAFYELYKLYPDFVIKLIENFQIFDQINEPFGKPRKSASDLDKLNSNLFHYVSEKGVGYSFDPNLGFFDGRTIIFPSLQILKILGYKCIDLFGVDMTAPQRFYENNLTLSKAPSYLDRDFETKILPSLDLISSYFKTNEIQVFNHSQLSRIPDNVIKKV